MATDNKEAVQDALPGAKVPQERALGASVLCVYVVVCVCMSDCVCDCECV